MKKYLIVGLIILVAAAMIIVQFTKPGPGPIVEPDPIPVEFTFTNNLAVEYNTQVKLEIDVIQDDVNKVEIKLDGEVLKTWDKPKKGKLSYDFISTTLGAKRLDLVSTRNDGKTFTDDRIVRTLSDIKPELLVAEYENAYAHEVSSFTQGLEFYKGRLFEGTGQYGQSQIFEVDLESGAINPDFKIGLDGNYFGEGITILNDTIYQLTWREGKCFTYAIGDHLQITSKEFLYTGEGWGICNDGTSLIVSNGSERLTFRNPQTFEIERSIDVFTNTDAVTNLNELEYHDGKIYANVWQYNTVVVIDPETGRVLQTINCNKLVSVGRGATGEVLNGIAVNEGKFYMTGKNWHRLLEVSFRAPIQ